MGKNSELSPRGRYWLREIGVPLVPTGVQAGHQNPARVVLKIQVKGLFAGESREAGWRKLAKGVEAPGVRISELE